MGRVQKSPGRRVRKLNKSQVAMILQVRNYFELEKEHQKSFNLNKVLVRTAEATGFSRAAVAKIKTQRDVDEWKFDDGDTITWTRDSVVPEKYSSLVRFAVRELILEKSKALTIDSVLEKLKSIQIADVQHLNLLEDEDIPDSSEVLWKWSRATLHRFMIRIGFIHDERVTHYEHTRTRADIVSMRDNYLEWIQKYRSMGYSVYYQDETWVFKNMKSKKVWTDKTGNALVNQPKAPSGSGERSILAHVCSEETGLLENCMLLFRGKNSKNSDDYHTEMNWSVFSDWCETKVFPAIAKTGKNSVIVFDRATYHTVLDDNDRRPVQSWNKNRLICAILRWGGPPEDWTVEWKSKKTKAQLLEYARKLYPEPKYKIQKIADKFSTASFQLKVLFLPVAHPELNPIEMVWSIIKRYVASRNLNFRLSDVERLTREKIGLITTQEIKKFTSHTLKEEEKFKEMSEVADDTDNTAAETESESDLSE